MDYFLTTYKKDFKWPVVRTSAQQKQFENEIKMKEVALKDAEPYMKEGLPEPMVKSEVKPGEVMPAQTGAPPQGPGSKYDQPNAYLRKLYTKYPYLYNVMKMTSPDEMVKRIMSEKYKTTYQVEYNKDDFHPANDFTAVMDVVEAAEKTAVDNQAAQSACSPKGVPPPKCPCAQGLSYAPCKCAKDAPVRKIAWKPALISKIPQAPREKENKKKEGEDRAQQAAGSSKVKVKPFRTEYHDTICKVGNIIIKKKLLSKEHLEASAKA